MCACAARVEFHDTDGKFHQPPTNLMGAFPLPPQIAAVSAQRCAISLFGATVWCEYRTWKFHVTLNCQIDQTCCLMRHLVKLTANSN